MIVNLKNFSSESYYDIFLRLLGESNFSLFDPSVSDFPFLDELLELYQRWPMNLAESLHQKYFIRIFFYFEKITERETETEESSIGCPTLQVTIAARAGAA